MSYFPGSPQTQPTFASHKKIKSALAGLALWATPASAADNYVCTHPESLRKEIDYYYNDVIKRLEDRKGVCFDNDEVSLEFDKKGLPQVCKDAYKALTENGTSEMQQGEWELLLDNTPDQFWTASDKKDVENKISALLKTRYNDLKKADMGLMAGIPVDAEKCP